MRKAISTRSRFEIFKRDNFTCAYCGRTPPAVILHVDHILAVANGGGNDPLNLITSCADCNLGKSDKCLKDRIQPIADQVEIEKERREQVKKYNAFLRSRKKKTDADVSRVSRAIISAGGWDPDQYVVGDCWLQSIRYFLRNLPVEEVLLFVEITAERIGFNNQTLGGYKYFCKVCHNKINGVEWK